MNEEIDFLQSHSLFGGLSNEEMEKVLPFMREKGYGKGELILQEGQVNDRLFFIYRGSVEIIKRARRITSLKAGDTFGEMEVIDIQPCIASVRALEPTTVLTLSSVDLYKISKMNLKTFTMIIMNLAREISRRLRRMDEIVSRGSFPEDFIVE